MGSEDDTVIMPRGENGEIPPEGQPPSGPGGSQGQPGRDKIIIIASIVAVFIVAAVIVIVIRACGGDEPAPKSETVTETVVRTTTVEPTTPATTGATSPAPRGDIHAVNWKSEVGAQPLVKDVEDVIYADLDGDGHEDALVLVRNEGSGGYLDYYVYTYRGEDLTRLFAKTAVDRGHVELASLPHSFIETTPVFAPGDPNCCPSRLRKTTYTWSASAGTFVETGVEEGPNPDV